MEKNKNRPLIKKIFITLIAGIISSIISIILYSKDIYPEFMCANCKYQSQRGYPLPMLEIMPNEKYEAWKISKIFYKNTLINFIIWTTTSYLILLGVNKWKKKNII